MQCCICNKEHDVNDAVSAMELYCKRDGQTVIAVICRECAQDPENLEKYRNVKDTQTPG